MEGRVAARAVMLDPLACLHLHPIFFLLRGGQTRVRTGEGALITRCLPVWRSFLGWTGPLHGAPFFGYEREKI